jgi:hypothetical protein
MISETRMEESDLEFGVVPGDKDEELGTLTIDTAS